MNFPLGFTPTMLPESVTDGDVVLWPKQSAEADWKVEEEIIHQARSLTEKRQGEGEQTQKGKQGRRQDNLRLTEQNLYLFYIFEYILVDFCVICTVAHGNSTIFKPYLMICTLLPLNIPSEITAVGHCSQTSSTQAPVVKRAHYWKPQRRNIFPEQIWKAVLLALWKKSLLNALDVNMVFCLKQTKVHFSPVRCWIA